jgi:hypothetical protein
MFLLILRSSWYLCKRGILNRDETRCPLCNLEMESTLHLFLHCPFASAVWYALNRWLGVMVVPPWDVVMSYGQLVCSGRNRKIRKGFSSVWLAFIWVIWKIRNDRVFNNVNGDVDTAVDCIQRLSWQWFLNIVAANSCLLYEWVWDPDVCMNRWLFGCLVRGFWLVAATSFVFCLLLFLCFAALGLLYVIISCWASGNYIDFKVI